jgi:hypothetical protein
MFARKTRAPKPPLKQAIALIDQALDIAETYRRDNAYTPDSEDIRQFDALLAALWANHCTLEHIVKNLRERTPHWQQSGAILRHFPELR